MRLGTKSSRKKKPITIYSSLSLKRILTIKHRLPSHLGRKMINLLLQELPPKCFNVFTPSLVCLSVASQSVNFSEGQIVGPRPIEAFEDARRSATS